LGTQCGSIHERSWNGPIPVRVPAPISWADQAPAYICGRSRASTLSSAPAGAYSGSGGSPLALITRARSSGFRSAQ